MSRLSAWLRHRRHTRNPPQRQPRQPRNNYAERISRSLEGVFERSCNICGYSGKFRAFGRPPRFDVLCPGCGSLDRHRLFALWLAREGKAYVRGKAVLHFAPEPSIARLLEADAAHYEQARYDPRTPDKGVNIEAMPYAENGFDAAICSHVLEHVDDAAALRELYRVLRPGGVAALMLPVVEGWDTTYENADIETARKRLLHFGQEDHVRIFGRDVRTRIAAAGFHVEEFTAVEPFVSRHGLTRGEKVFVCIKTGRRSGRGNKA